MNIFRKKIFISLISLTILMNYLLIESKNVQNEAVNIQDKIIFVDKFLDYLNETVGKGIGFLCWKRDDILHLTKMFYTRFFANKIHNRIHHDINFKSLTKGKYIFVTDTGCSFFKELMKKAEKEHLFQNTHIWIIFGEISNILKLRTYFTIESKVYLVEQQFKTETLNVVKAFMKTNFSLNYTIENIGDWSIDRKMFITKNEIEKEPFINFMGEPLRVSYALLYYNQTINHLIDYRGNGQDLIPKMNYAMFTQICFYLNATHTPILGNHWGLFNRTTGYFSTGMFLDLQLGNADAGGNTNLMTGPRIDNFTYLASGATTDDFVYWFFRNPRLSYTANIWTLPFQTLTWLCLVQLIGLFLMGLAVIARMEIAVPWFSIERGSDIKSFGIGDMLDVVYAVITQRGIPLNLKSLSGQIALYTLNILTLFLFTAYSAQFVVLLQSPSHTINDYETLFKTGIEMGAENMSYNKIYYMVENDLTPHDLRVKLYDSKIKSRESKFYMDLETGMKKVQKQWFAFQTLRSSAYRVVQKTFNDFETKSLKNVDTFIGGQMVYLCLSKNSPYYDVVSRALLKLQENGMKKREHLKIYPSKALPDYASSVFVSIGLEEIYFVHFILHGGIILSLVIFIGEHISYRYEKIRENKKRLVFRNTRTRFSFVE